MPKKIHKKKGGMNPNDPTYNQVEGVSPDPTYNQVEGVSPGSNNSWDRENNSSSNARNSSNGSNASNNGFSPPDEVVNLLREQLGNFEALKSKALKSESLKSKRPTVAALAAKFSRGDEGASKTKKKSSYPL